MTRYEIAFAPEAVVQLEQIRAWWLEHRPAAPTLFDDEVVATIELRRVLMPRTRYHAYYAVDERSARITILAVWHATRGHGPPLR